VVLGLRILLLLTSINGGIGSDDFSFLIVIWWFVRIWYLVSGIWYQVSGGERLLVFLARTGMGKGWGRENMARRALVV